jgi:hypothetical protein
MESKLINKPWGWEYVSKNGIEYSVGEVTADFNVVVDDFNDINELFDCEALILAKPIDYVYGDLVGDHKEIKEWLDERIEKYEKYERTVKFYPNLIKRDDAEVLYECYIGTEKKQAKKSKRISVEKMLEIAEDIKGGK